MNQSALNLSPPQGPVERAVLALRRDPLSFKSVTVGWILKNHGVWCEFYNRAERLRLAGRKNYGAKCIYEAMRYDTAVRDAEITFKLNNNHVSGLARLYNAVSGFDYFQTRDQAA